MLPLRVAVDTELDRECTADDGLLPSRDVVAAVGADDIGVAVMEEETFCSIVDGAVVEVVVEGSVVVEADEEKSVEADEEKSEAPAVVGVVVSAGFVLVLDGFKTHSVVVGPANVMPTDDGRASAIVTYYPRRKQIACAGRKRERERARESACVSSRDVYIYEHTPFSFFPLTSSRR